jgi:hypothetical protein
VLLRLQNATKMVIHRSLLGNLPPFPPTNIHNFLFRRPGQDEVPDYVLQIDTLTGEARTRKEFLHRVCRLATALASPNEKGGLGLKVGDGHVIGIFSDNVLVRNHFAVVGSNIH